MSPTYTVEGGQSSFTSPGFLEPPIPLGLTVPEIPPWLNEAKMPRYRYSKANHPPGQLKPNQATGSVYSHNMSPVYDAYSDRRLPPLSLSSRERTQQPSESQRPLATNDIRDMTLPSLPLLLPRPSREGSTTSSNRDTQSIHPYREVRRGRETPRSQSASCCSKVRRAVESARISVDDCGINPVSTPKLPPPAIMQVLETGKTINPEIPFIDGISHLQQRQEGLEWEVKRLKQKLQREHRYKMHFVRKLKQLEQGRKPEMKKQKQRWKKEIARQVLKLKQRLKQEKQSSAPQNKKRTSHANARATSGQGPSPSLPEPTSRSRRPEKENKKGSTPHQAAHRQDNELVEDEIVVACPLKEKKARHTS